jgi:hypothetical protein
MNWLWNKAMSFFMISKSVKNVFEILSSFPRCLKQTWKSLNLHSYWVLQLVLYSMEIEWASEVVPLNGSFEQLQFVAEFIYMSK